MAEEIVVEAGGRSVSITHPDKVFFSQRGETKLDLVEYYRAVEGPLMETVRDRPVLLERYPEGAGGKSFFQKRVPKSAPDWLTTTVVSTPNGTTSDALVAADLGHLLWGVNQGCLGFHVWPNRLPDLEVADELRVDLDPSPGIGFEQLQEAAVLAHDLLDELGIEALHQDVGLTWAAPLRRARAAVGQLRGAGGGGGAGPRARAAPPRSHHRGVVEGGARQPRVRRLQPERAAQDRVRRVVRRGRASAPRCPRRSRGTTSPTWCPTSSPSRPCPARLAERGNAWAGMYDRPQDLTPLLERSAHDLANGLLDAPWPPVYPKMPHEPPRVAPSRARTT